MFTVQKFYSTRWKIGNFTSWSRRTKKEKFKYLLSEVKFLKYNVKSLYFIIVKYSIIRHNIIPILRNTFKYVFYNINLFQFSWNISFYSSVFSPRHLIIAALHMISVTEQILLQVPLEKYWQNVHPIPVPGHILPITVLHSIFSVMKVVTFEMNVEFDVGASRFSLNPKNVLMGFRWSFSGFVRYNRGAFQMFLLMIIECNDLCGPKAFDITFKFSKTWP